MTAKPRREFQLYECFICNKNQPNADAHLDHCRRNHKKMYAMFRRGKFPDIQPCRFCREKFNRKKILRNLSHLMIHTQHRHKADAGVLDDELHKLNAEYYDDWEDSSSVLLTLFTDTYNSFPFRIPVHNITGIIKPLTCLTSYKRIFYLCRATAMLWADIFFIPERDEPTGANVTDYDKSTANVIEKKTHISYLMFRYAQPPGCAKRF